MTKSYSADLGERAARANMSNVLARSAARLLVSASTAVKGANVGARQEKGVASTVRVHRRSPSVDHSDGLLAHIAEQPDLTVEEMLERRGKRGVSSPWRFSKRATLS